MLRLNYNKMKNKIKNHRQNGLTLIEILVVLAILLLFLIALFAAFGGRINRTRDAQRKNDLKNIKLAFEDYYNDRSTYPPEESLADCGGSSLQPYLKTVPCDPITGEPYVYVPYPGGGDNSDGYRVLSLLDDFSDPIIEKLGCVGGCGGIPEDHPKYQDSHKYVYMIAEGATLASGDIPAPTVEPSYCDTHLCYCCSYSAYNSPQNCNIWSDSGGTCNMGPYATVSDCYNETPCVNDEL